MGAERSERQNLDDIRGQSVMEFLLVLPLLIGLTVTLVRINSAIQISIVNQRYARAQALFLTYNSPIYPRLELQQSSMISSGTHQMVMGVSDNQATPGYTPDATVQQITRSRRVQGSDAPKEEPNMRSRVRIRNTVTLCTQNVTVPAAGGGGGGSAVMVPILPLSPDYKPLGPVALSEGVRLNNFCNKGTIKYEQ